MTPEDMRKRIRDLEGWNATQERTIDDYRRTNRSLRKQITKERGRVEPLQKMADWRANRIAELEAQLTPQAQAERFFKDGRD